MRDESKSKRQHKDKLKKSRRTQTSEKSEVEFNWRKEEIEKNENRFKILLESAPIGIYYNDFSGKFLYGNKRAEEIVGYEREELIGKNFLKLKLLSPREIKKAAKILAMNRFGKSTGPDEFILNRKDGSTRIIEVTTRIVTIDGKKAVMGMVQDVTDRKKMEERMRGQEKRYHALFDRTNDGVFIISLEGIHLEVNQRAADMLGYKINEIVGRLSTDFTSPGELQNGLEKRDELLTGKELPVYERTFRRKDGTEFPAEINARLVFDDDGKPSHIHSIVRDITERKQSEERLKVSLKEKEMLFKEIHHRVNNNLQIVSSLLSLQSRNVEDNKIREMFKQTRSRVLSMGLIHELLYQNKDFTRINMANYLHRLSAHLFQSNKVNTDNIRLKLGIDGFELDINKAVPCALIINELVSNSLKHAFPDNKSGEIYIKLHKNSNQHILIVRDNGVGFPKSIDLSAPETLGFQLVTGLVRQLDGRITLSGEGGTTISITF